MTRRPLALGLVLAACGGAEASGPREPSAATVGVERRDVTMKHEPCDLNSKRAVSLDANADGRPEIITVLDGDKFLCRAADINLDGTIDVYSYFDSNGQPRRRESGFDRDELPDEIAFFSNGVLVRKERETNNDGKIDTWDYYENGRIVREERDSSGDGFINQWWTFDDPARPECAYVMTDANSDARPDPETKVDLCGRDDEPQRRAAPKAPARSASSAVPASSAAPAPAPKGGP